MATKKSPPRRTAKADSKKASKPEAKRTKSKRAGAKKAAVRKPVAKKATKNGGRAAAKKAAPRKRATGTRAARFRAMAAATSSTRTGTVFVDHSAGRVSLVEGTKQTVMTCSSSCDEAGFDQAFDDFSNTPPGKEITIEGFDDPCDGVPALHVTKGCNSD